MNSNNYSITSSTLLISSFACTRNIPSIHSCRELKLSAVRIEWFNNMPLSIVEDGYWCVEYKQNEDRSRESHHLDPTHLLPPCTRKGHGRILVHQYIHPSITVLYVGYGHPIWTSLKMIQHEPCNTGVLSALIWPNTLW